MLTGHVRPLYPFCMLWVGEWIDRLIEYVAGKWMPLILYERYQNITNQLRKIYLSLKQRSLNLCNCWLLWDYSSSSPQLEVTFCWVLRQFISIIFLCWLFHFYNWHGQPKIKHNIRQTEYTTLKTFTIHCHGLHWLWVFNEDHVNSTRHNDVLRIYSLL